jgi:hypothetical protein
VPLKLTETSTIEGGNLARATTAETYAQIAKDLTEAAAVLPATWPAGDFGRATKGAALALLGKAHLQHAGAYGATADYQKALDALKQVTGYTLDANYASLFDGSNERSAEIIWSIQNVRVDGYGGTLTEWFSPITSPQIYQGGAQNQFQAERPFYESYNAADVRRAGTWLTTISYAGRTVNWAWTAGIQAATQYGSTGPGVRKYVDFAAADGGAEGPDYVILRHADVLLSQAEVINELSGPTGEAYALVNQVRTRARVPNLVAGLSKAAFKDSLFSDRRFELAMEMHGVFDSRRHWTWAKGASRRTSATWRRSTAPRSPAAPRSSPRARRRSTTSGACIRSPRARASSTRSWRRTRVGPTASASEGAHALARPRRGRRVRRCARGGSGGGSGGGRRTGRDRADRGAAPRRAARRGAGRSQATRERR